MHTWSAQTVRIPFSDADYFQMANLTQQLHVQLSAVPAMRVVLTAWREADSQPVN
jgi:hypothetical protein